MAKAIEIRWEDSGQNNKQRLYCFDDGKLVHSDTIDLNKAQSRKTVAGVLVDLGFDPTSVERELMRATNDLLDAMQGTVEIAQETEVEPNRILRPERFLCPDFSGVAVPLMKNGQAGLEGSWVWYVVDHGKRTQIPLSEFLEVNGETIFFNPMPAPPDVMVVGNWSKSSRKDWLEHRGQVTLSDLFNKLQNAIDHFLEFPSESAQEYRDLLACWIILSYSYHAWPAVPYLLVNGPLQSGKSKLFAVLRELVFRPFVTDNVSAAGIFRTLNNVGGTLLFDEAERLRDARSTDVTEINSMLLAGYQKGRCATRIERIGDEFKPKSYDVYGPKGIACINGVLPALQSRCIEIATQRANIASPKPKRSMSEVDWQAIRDDLHVTTLDYSGPMLRAVQNVAVCSHLNGRDFELWQPILAIADLVGDKSVVARLQAFSDRQSKELSELKTPETDELLLRSLAFLRKAQKFPTSTELLEIAKIESASLFYNWSPESVGRRMRAYGLRPVRTGSRREYRTDLNVLSDVQSLYGVELGVTSGFDRSDTVSHAPTSDSCDSSDCHL